MYSCVLNVNEHVENVETEEDLARGQHSSIETNLVISSSSVSLSAMLKCNFEAGLCRAIAMES